MPSVICASIGSANEGYRCILGTNGISSVWHLQPWLNISLDMIKGSSVCVCVCLLDVNAKRYYDRMCNRNVRCVCVGLNIIPTTDDMTRKSTILLLHNWAFVPYSLICLWSDLFGTKKFWQRWTWNKRNILSFFIIHGEDVLIPIFFTWVLLFGITSIAISIWVRNTSTIKPEIIF